MRVTFLCFVVSLVILQFAPAQEEQFGKRDGYFWQDYHDTAKLILKNTQVSNMEEGIRILEKHFKSNYILGIFDLASTLPTDNYYFALESVDGTKSYFEAAHLFPHIYRVSPDQIVKALDRFYQDYRNLNVLILDAMHIANMEITGKDPSEIEWQTRYYRADSDTRRQMIIDKSTKK